MTLLIALVLAPFALMTFCFAVEVFVGVTPLKQPEFKNPDQATAVIIVPAHNEELGIQCTLERLIASAAARAKILVVADNCTDSTATIARLLGVEVIERSDPARRGKGFALDFAREHLRADPPDVVIIVDADCSIDGESISALVNACASKRLPCQATNLQRPSLLASPSVQLSTFAFFIKNVIRQRALKRLAGRAHLFGTGMALPWPIFAAAELATSNIVEDLKLGLDLSDAGQSPLFIEQAEVWSSPESEANMIAQRQRWEGGYMQNAKRVGPGLLLRGVTSADVRLIWAGIDLMIPPFALLLLLDLVVLIGAVAVGLFIPVSKWPLWSLCAALVLASLALALAWVNGGRRFVSLKSLGRAPFYLAWKLPMYARFIQQGVPKEWQRTNRR